MEYAEIEVLLPILIAWGVQVFVLVLHLNLLTYRVSKYSFQEGPRFPITQCTVVYIYLGTGGATRLYRRQYL